MTLLIFLHCEFPPEEDLGSSSLFTISEMRPAQHQKASMAVNTARRVPGRVEVAGGGVVVAVLAPHGTAVITVPPGEESIHRVTGKSRAKRAGACHRTRAVRRLCISSVVKVFTAIKVL